MTLTYSFRVSFAGDGDVLTFGTSETKFEAFAPTSQVRRSAYLSPCKSFLVASMGPLDVSGMLRTFKDV